MILSLIKTKNIQFWVLFTQAIISRLINNPILEWTNFTMQHKCLMPFFANTTNDKWIWYNWLNNYEDFPSFLSSSLLSVVLSELDSVEEEDEAASLSAAIYKTKYMN